MLLHLYNQPLTMTLFYFQRVVNAWQHQFCLRTFKIDVYNRSYNLRDMSNNL